MNDPSTPDEPMPDDLGPLFIDAEQSDPQDDPMFDAMLAEVLRGESPSDLRGQILQRLEDIPRTSEPGALEPVRLEIEQGVDPEAGSPAAELRGASKTPRALRARKTRPGKPQSQSPPMLRVRENWKWLTAVAAVMLLALGVGWNITRTPNDPVVRSAERSGSNAQQNHRRYSIANSLPSELSPGDNSADTPSADTDTAVVSEDRRQPIRIASVDSSTEGPASSVADGDKGVNRISEDPLPASSISEDSANGNPAASPVLLASKQLHQQFHTYWDRVGVTPTRMKSDKEIAELIKARLGLRIPVDQVRDFEAVSAAIPETWSVKRLAARLLATWSMRPVDDLDSESDEAMIRQLTNQLRQRKSVADLFVRWMQVPDQIPEKYDAELTAWAELVSPLSPHSRVVATAAVTMDRDLRCGRCHDVDSSESLSRQSDYWQFAALVDPISQPQTWNTLRDIREGASWDERGLSYETLERQTKQVEPGVPADWRRASARLSEKTASLSEKEEVSTKVARWAGELKQSRALAAGLVSTTWQLVHGRPLKNQPLDLCSAPADPMLEEMHRRLTDDLIASRFDLVRTIALMVTDPAFGRDIPEAMSESRWLLASNEQWQAASTQVNAWAAGSQTVSLPSSDQRMRLAKSLIPNGRLSESNLRESLLGQTVPGKKPSKTVPDAASLAAELMPAGGFPARTTIATPTWLEQLPSFESQVNHVVHLAGRDQVSSSELELARRMKDVSTDQTLLWQRLWWTIR